jgi:hypothetical protein
MSYFYGRIQGRAQHPATQCGTRKSGLITEAASFQGCVRVRVWTGPTKDSPDTCEVTLQPWHNKGTYQRIYVGPIGSWPSLNECPRCHHTLRYSAGHLDDTTFIYPVECTRNGCGWYGTAVYDLTPAGLFPGDDLPETASPEDDL